MHIKTPKQQYLKSLQTKNVNNVGKRTTVSPTVYTFRHREFKLVLPAELRDFVKNSSGVDQIKYDCVPVMNLMLTCFKKNDYDQVLCSKEIRDFKSCYTTYSTQLKKFQDDEKMGIYNFEAGQTRFPTKIVQNLLEKYKQPKKIDNGPIRNPKKK